MEEKNVIKEDEIDLIELLKVILDQKIFIFKVTGVFFFLGIFIALTSKVEYQAYSRLLPESQKEALSLGGLGGLAGLAGFDLSNLGSTSVLSPELYPEIVNSAPFLNKLINTPIYFEKIDTTISSYDYFKGFDRPSLLGFIGEYTIGLPGKVKDLFSSSPEMELRDYDLIRFSKEEWKIIKKYGDRLSVSVDKKAGIVSVSAEMPDPVAAAKLTELLVQELTQNVTTYKIEKSQKSLRFIAERFDEAKNEYELKQNGLARFTDRNRNISNSIVQTEYERLQNELNISFEIYKGLATQLEQAKIKVKEETPVFTVLEPIKIPINKSKPKRVILIAVFIFLGLIVSLCAVVVKSLFIKS